MYLAERARNNYIDQEYDELEEFGHYVDRVGSQTVYAQTGLDTVVRPLITSHFKYRKLVDNERFQDYFVRTCKEILSQYNSYLRIESTEWDPMVTLYMERQILDASSQSSSGNKNTSGSSSGNFTNNTDSSNSTSYTSRDQSNTSNETEEDTTGHTHNDDRTSTMGLQGSTPDSSMYPENSGMPLRLNWKFTSEQTENSNINNLVSDTTGSRNTTNTGNTESEGSGSSNGNQNSTSYGNNSGTTRSNETDSSITNSNADRKERSSGRSESPTDLLDRARNYVLKTNAFLWLCDKLDVCFMGVTEI